MMKHLMRHFQVVEFERSTTPGAVSTFFPERLGRRAPLIPHRLRRQKAGFSYAKRLFQTMTIAKYMLFHLTL